MKIANIFKVLKADANLVALLQSVENGKTILRAYEFGLAPDEPKFPYVTWQLVSATPHNTYSERHKAQTQVLQFDVWALSADTCENVSEALEYAIELEGYILSYRGAEKDLEGVFRISFDFELLSQRTF